MKLKDVHTSQMRKLWIKPFAGQSLAPGLGAIDPGPGDDLYKLNLAGNWVDFTLRDEVDKNDLNHFLKRCCANAAEIENIAPDGGALMRVVFFYGLLVEMGDIEVGFDAKFLASANTIGLSGEPKRIAEALREKCALTINGEKYFIFLCGPPADKDFEEDQKKTAGEAPAEDTEPEEARAFSLHGERLRIPVKKRGLGRTGEILFTSKLIGEMVEKEGAWRLAKGSVTFSFSPDGTKTAPLGYLARGALDQMSQEAGNYLRQWDKFTGLEGELLLDKARSIGIINYIGEPIKTLNGLEFTVAHPPALKRLSEGDILEITAEEPVYLQERGLSWGEYNEILQRETRYNLRGPRRKTAKILSLSPTSLELKLESAPLQGQFLVFSIHGDAKQIRRRMLARSEVLEGRSANPLLGLLIEEGAELPSGRREPQARRRVGHLAPLTPFVSGKIFTRGYTENQKEAIKIALNTPDIALIQGPPGTGKTTVITAIIERLNEEHDKTEQVRGQILVTAYQHAAVENICSRLSVNDLPTIKFGGKSQDDDSEPAPDREITEAWCAEVAEKIRRNNPGLKPLEDQRRLTELMAAYGECPSEAGAVNLVERILELFGARLSGDLFSEAQNILQALRGKPRSSDPAAWGPIRALRLTKAAFKDDGPERALAALLEIKKDLAPNEAALLEKAGTWRPGEPLDFLVELKTLKYKLLSQKPPPELGRPKARADVLNLVSGISKILNHSQNHGHKREAALAEFLHELENNPEGVRDALKDYNFVFAATVQQAARREIADEKKKFGQETVFYDTVIVDEAARVSPMDLLIPMAQAEKRIILVGDHRQLPHFINDETMRALEDAEGRRRSGKIEEAIKLDLGETEGMPDFKTSMFEYLVARSKKLEKSDGIPRTITLNSQFRSHPTLGKFVSDNFYKDYGEGYESPLPEENFYHELPGIEGKAAVWIDVPDAPEERTDSKSRVRPEEARVLAEYLNDWINSAAGAKLSFGVISFYKGQVEAIHEALKRFDLTVKPGEEPWQIAEKYRRLENGEERLKIGTVDAFQGMEFDVVFLSMVRSLRLRTPAGATEGEITPQRFGFLRSKNRLCVSLSRQKKVLALVGDSGLIKTETAKEKEAVPALRNFYDLCENQGTVLCPKTCISR